MASHNSLLLNVARNLRYRTLAPMIGQSLTISDRSRIATETTAFVARFADGCCFAGPEQKYLDVQIAKIGILDLRFTSPSTTLASDAPGGVPLLRELGFVGRDWQELTEEIGDDSAFCLEELRDGIAENATHLMLFLQASNPKESEMSTTDRMARIRDPSIIKFPINFTVVDACVSNSSFVWMNKHFYM